MDIEHAIAVLAVLSFSLSLPGHPVAQPPHVPAPSAIATEATGHAAHEVEARVECGRPEVAKLQAAKSAVCANRSGPSGS